MATVAVLDIHMDKKAVINIMPNMIPHCFLLMTFRNMSHKANRLCNPDSSMPMAMARPPMNMNMVALKYLEQMDEVLEISAKGKATMGMSEVTGNGKAWVIQ